jgi:hypothetical protein
MDSNTPAVGERGPAFGKTASVIFKQFCLAALAAKLWSRVNAAHRVDRIISYPTDVQLTVAYSPR